MENIPKDILNSLQTDSILFENMPLAAAVIRVDTDEKNIPVDFSFTYVNQAMVELVGRSKEKMVGESYYKVFLNGDQNWLYECWETAYRGVDKELQDYSPEIGRYLSISCFQPCFGYCACLIRDVTDRKLLEREVKINEERLQIVLENSVDFIFDLNIDTNEVITPKNTVKKFGLPFIVTSMPGSFVEHGMISEKDGRKIQKVIDTIKSGETTTSCEISVSSFFGGGGAENLNCQWYSLTLTLFENQQSRYAIGFIKNINHEKIKHLELQEKADSDLLTGVYNKATGEEKISNRMKASNSERNHHSLFIIDIDNFKRVNDKHGHYVGDTVLKMVAEILLSAFRKEDIVCRIGGDEYIVLAVDVYDEEFVDRVCRNIMDTVKEDLGLNYGVTLSIGVAAYGIHGTTFPELYKTADTALYIVKNSGKNNYEIFRQ